MNLANASSAEKAFASDDGPFDIVYNLAAETKYGQSEEVCARHLFSWSRCVTSPMNESLFKWTQVYKERVLTVATNCAQQAAKTGVKRFIHVSTAQVYNSDKVACRFALRWYCVK